MEPSQQNTLDLAFPSSNAKEANYTANEHVATSQCKPKQANTCIDDTQERPGNDSTSQLNSTDSNTFSINEEVIITTQTPKYSPEATEDNTIISSPQKNSVINKIEKNSVVINMTEKPVSISSIHNSPTQEIVPQLDITQLPVNTTTNQKIISHNSISSPTPMDLDQISVSDNSTQIPSPQMVTNDINSISTSKIQESINSSLPDQSLDQDPTVTQPEQITHQESITMQSNFINEKPTELDCNGITESTSINSNQKLISSDCADDKVTKIENNESDTKKKVGRKPGRKPGKKEKAVITPREPRKRRATTQINYCEEIIEDPELMENPPKKMKHKEVKELDEQKLTAIEEPKDDHGPKNQKCAKVKELKKKVTKGRGRGRKKAVVEEDDMMQIDDTQEVSEELEHSKIKNLLQDKSSFLSDLNLKELIPQWLDAFSEEDKQELAQLLPWFDSKTQAGELASIKNGFDAYHLYDAASKWQDILALGGFEATTKEPKAETCADTFKDDNYEKNWGERLKRNQKTPKRGRGRPKKT